MTAADQGLPPGIPRPGDVLAGGKYHVEEILAVGGMGVVVAARHLALEQRVAIKFLLPDATKHAEAVPRFLSEARSAAQIASEHVVRILDVDTLEGGGTPYIVMEYLEGDDLGNLLLRRGRLPMPEALGYFLQACEGVAEAHARGIIHRDLKPPNLFLTRRSDGSALVKVLDFGLVKRSPLGGRPDARLTKMSSVMGTPHYMSPEQIRSSAMVDARSDVWSLGVILFELLTASTPFDGTTSSAVCAQIAADLPPPLRTKLPDAPEALENILLKALEKDPARRYASVGELALALSPLARGAASKLSLERIRKLAGGQADAMDAVSPYDTLVLQGSTHPTDRQVKLEPSRRTARFVALGVVFVTAALAITLLWPRGSNTPSASEREPEAEAAATSITPPPAPATVAAPPPVSATPASAEPTEEPEEPAKTRRIRKKAGPAVTKNPEDLDIRLER